MIGNKLSKESLQVLKCSIDELLTNVDEHSQYKNSFILLQHYPSHEKLEFSLMDDGIFIPGNFKKHGIDFENDSDSLKKALNGVSTKGEEEGRGYGLSSVFKGLTIGMQGEGIIVLGRGILSSTFVTEERDPCIKLYNYGDNSEDSTVFRGCYVSFRVITNLSPDLYRYI